MDLYGGFKKENPMPYKELAEHCGVCSATIASVQPNESLAIRVGRTKLTTMNFTDFEE